MLAPRPGGAEHLHLHVRRVQVHLHLLHLGQDGHRGGGGVDTPAGLGLRHPLDPVDAALELHPGPGPVPLDSEGDLLYPSQFRHVQAGHFRLPAAALGVHGVHAVEGVGEEGGLLPPHPGPDLHDDVLPIVGVPGEQQELELPLQPLQLLPGLLLLLLGQLPQLRIGEQGPGLLLPLPGPEVGPVCLHHRGQLVLLLVQPGHLGGVVIGLRRGQPGLDLAVSGLHGRQLVQHGHAPFRLMPAPGGPP